MRLIVNPGSEDLERGHQDNSSLNIEAFVKDLKLEGVTHERKREQDEGGRHAYAVQYNGREQIVHMPGLDLEQVRFTGAKEQNAWHYPRLYVDGSSWLWCYAVRILRGDFTDPEIHESEGI